MCFRSCEKPSFGEFEERWCLNEQVLPAPGLCAAWHPNGSMIAVGMASGEFVVYKIAAHGTALRRPLEQLVCKQTGKVAKQAGKKLTAFQKKFQEKLQAKKTGKQTLFKETEEIADVKWSPSGQFLACGSRDNFIHLYDVGARFKRIGICRGHSSYITHLDFSSNSEMLQSSDGAYELLYWEIDPVEKQNGKRGYRVQQYTSSFATRDVNWDTWTCTLGWPVQGIWPKFSDGTDVNSVHRCNAKKYMVTGDDYFKVKLFRYPCLLNAEGKAYSGHCSHIMNVRFLRNDSRVVSAGGNDCSVFVWKHRMVKDDPDDEDEDEVLVETSMEDILEREAEEATACFRGKDDEEEEDAKRREGLDADYDLDALKRAGRMAHGFDPGDGVNQELGFASADTDAEAARQAAEAAEAAAAAAAKKKAEAAAKGGQTAKALFDHDADDPDELPFKEGDEITVTEHDDEDEWWTGEFNGRTGQFPSSYVELQ